MKCDYLYHTVTFNLKFLENVFRTFRESVWSVKYYVWGNAIIFTIVLLTQKDNNEQYFHRIVNFSRSIMIAIEK